MFLLKKFTFSLSCMTIRRIIYIVILHLLWLWFSPEALPFKIGLLLLLLLFIIGILSDGQRIKVNEIVGQHYVPRQDWWDLIDDHLLTTSGDPSVADDKLTLYPQCILEMHKLYNIYKLMYIKFVIMPSKLLNIVYKFM